MQQKQPSAREDKQAKGNVFSSISLHLGAKGQCFLFQSPSSGLPPEGTTHTKGGSFHHKYSNLENSSCPPPHCFPFHWFQIQTCWWEFRFLSVWACGQWSSVDVLPSVFLGRLLGYRVSKKPPVLPRGCSGSFNYFVSAAWEPPFAVSGLTSGAVFFILSMCWEWYLSHGF